MPLQKGHTINLGRTRKLSNDEKKAKNLMNLAIVHKTLPLIRSALGVALGTRFVYKREKTVDDKGKETFKNILLEDPAQIEEALDLIEDGGRDPDDNYYYITTKEPDYKAIEMLLSRAYGKPKESLEVEGQIDFVHSLRELSLKALKRNKEDEEIKVIDVPVVRQIENAS